MPNLPEPQTIPEMLRSLSSRYSERILATCGKEQVSYKDVEGQSAKIALGLAGSGVGKAQRVGILMPNSPLWVTTWFSAARMGALVVGLSTFLKPKELAWIIRFADLDTLIISDHYLKHDYVAELEAALPSLAGQSSVGRLVLPEAPYLRNIWVFGDQTPSWSSGGQEELCQSGAVFMKSDPDFLRTLEANILPADLAASIFTSGTTAEPKGVVHTHGTIVRRAYEMFDYGPCAPGDKIGVLTPLFWVGGLLTNLLNTMVGGGNLVFPERPDPGYLVKFLRRECVDYLNGWSGQLNAIKAHHSFDSELFLRLKIANGTQGRAGIIGKPSTVPREHIPSMLGMTETFGPHSGELPEVELSEEEANSFGRGIGPVERLIVEPGTRKELSIGEIGELLVRSPTLFAGYYKRERSEAFEMDGFFRTGDRCHISKDGYLHFHGRIGEMIKTSGANVSPEEVERAILSIAEIDQAYVLGVPDEQVGERVEAVVVPVPHSTLTEDRIIECLKQDLSSYKIPKRILFMTRDDVPLSASQKVQKHKLLERLVETRSKLQQG